MAEVQYRAATCRHKGMDSDAVHDLTLTVDDGEFMVLVGPSGSGKSTALRMLAGLEETTSGEIRVGGRDVAGDEPKDRDIAMVFQNYALYPHMSVADNIGFALKMAGVPKQERSEKVLEAAKLLGIESYLERKPKALSGGQRQRVAMGRAIVRSPAVFLMDEPLSNLDAKLRVETRANIVTLQARLGTTTVYVTHDQVEAMTMGHRVAVLKEGVLQQVDTPRGLYDTPANSFVAGFIGSPAMNMIDARVTEAGVGIGGGELQLLSAGLSEARAADLERVVLGLRPEALSLTGPEQGGIPMDVTLVEELGADAYLHGTLGQNGDQAKVVARVDGRNAPQIGSRVGLYVDPDQVHVFNAESGARLG